MAKLHTNLQKKKLFRNILNNFLVGLILPKRFDKQAF